MQLIKTIVYIIEQAAAKQKEIKQIFTKHLPSLRGRLSSTVSYDFS